MRACHVKAIYLNLDTFRIICFLHCFSNLFQSKFLFSDAGIVAIVFGLTYEEVIWLKHTAKYEQKCKW